MKINNENEKYTLHFIFHTNILHIKSSRIPVMEDICYGETTDHTKHHT